LIGALRSLLAVDSGEQSFRRLAGKTAFRHQRKGGVQPIAGHRRRGWIPRKGHQAFLLDRYLQSLNTSIEPSCGDGKVLAEDFALQHTLEEQFQCLVAVVVCDSSPSQERDSGLTTGSKQWS